jgi:hypothetical protein
MAAGGTTDGIARRALFGVRVGGKRLTRRLGIVLRGAPYAFPFFWPAQNAEMLQDRCLYGIGQLAVVENEPATAILGVAVVMVDDGTTNVAEQRRKNVA